MHGIAVEPDKLSEAFMIQKTTRKLDDRRSVSKVTTLAHEAEGSSFKKY